MTPLVAYAVNWDTFGPDLLVGLATGLVVGLVLFVTERSAETRRNRDAATFAWQSLLPKLRSASAVPWRRDQSILTMPDALIKLDDLASREPLALWQSNFKSPEAAISGLLTIQRSKYSMEWSAELLEAALIAATRKIPARKDLHTDYLKQIVRVRAYGQTDSEAESPFVPHTPAVLARYSTAADELMKDSDLAIAMATYVEAADIYKTALNYLRPLLMETPKDTVEALKAHFGIDPLDGDTPTAEKRSRRLKTRRGGH
jgi:hypothetical protein